MKATTAELTRRRRRRWAVVLLLLVVLPLALIGAALVFIKTPPGQALLRRQVLKAVDGLLAGKLEAKDIELRGTNHVVLVDLKLFTPEGELVASIDRVEADVELGALARKRVNLSNVKISRPELFLTQDERGWNLMRAVATEEKTPLGADDQPNAWRVQIDDLALTDGLFDFKQEERRITATRIAVRGDANLRFDPLEVSGTLDLSSALTAPLQETLLAKIGGSASRGPQSYAVEVTLGGSRLRGQLELPGLDITVDELVAAPREVSAFLPGWPLRPVVFGKGSLHPTQAAVQLSAGKASLTVDAKYDLATSSAQTLIVRGKDIELEELIGASMQSTLAFEATGALTDWHPATLAGGLEGKVTWDARGGQRLASAQLRATAADGAIKVNPLDVTSPGFGVRARGTITPKQGEETSIDAFATITGKDLAQVGKTLEAFAGIDPGGLGGNGTVRVSMQGPLRGAAATAIGKLYKFSIAGVQADVLEFNADVPDVSEPLDTDIILSAQRLRFGEREIDDVTLDFVTHGRQLDLDLATKGMGDLRLHALALLDKDTQGLELRTTELTSAGSKWQLEAPTRLEWKNGFELAPFSLRDGEQHLSGKLSMTRSTLDATARAEKVDLARLPSLLAVPSLKLGGTLTGDAQVSGSLKRPEVVVDAQLTQGRVYDFEQLDVGLRASWKNERAKGTVQAQSTLGRVEGTFDLPVLAFLDEKPGEGTARFTLKDLPATELARQLDQALPVEGIVSAELDVSGSGARPKLRLTVRSKELALTREEQRYPAKAVEVAVFTTDTATLDGTATFSALGAQTQLTLNTPLTIATLRHQPPKKEELLSLPVTLAVAVRHLDLKQLDQLGLVHDDELAGTVSLSGVLRGTAKAPTGDLEVTLDDITFPPLRHGSAQLTVRTEDNHTRIAGTAGVAEVKKALELNATVGALPAVALGALLGPNGDVDALLAALRDAPLDLKATLMPFPFSALMQRQENGPRGGGVVSASLEARGTLESPNVRLVGALKDLKFDRVALGSGRFDLRSTGTEQPFTIVLGGEGRDDFKAKGKLGLDLRISKLRHGLDWRKAPIELSLDSRNFDVGFLSGATEVLRVVAGRVDLAGRVSGLLGDPKFVGDASVRNGRLALAGFGDYRDIALELHAANDLVELKKLEASSGAGTVQLVARAVRQPSGVFLLTSTGSSDKFPIVIDDQLQATATLRYVLEGDATSTLVDIKKLALPRVDLALPEVKRKDLQDLDRPKDIIVLRFGSRATRRRREAARQAAGEPPGAPFVLRARIDAPRNIWVRSSDVNIELGLSEEFRVEYSQSLKLFGDVRVLKGTVEVIGREFTVQKESVARFAGPAAQPSVNVSALHVNTREQVKITVSVTGKGTDLGFKVSSEPPMPESDIYAVLATGRRNLKTSGSATFTPGQAASVVGQLAASQLKTVIAKKLPIDVFNFDTSDNFEKVKLDVGKYLSDTVYLGGAVDIGARRDLGQNVWSGRIELQLTKHISLEAYAGDALSFGADVIWSRDF